MHSNGFSLVRSILKKIRYQNNLKRELLKPTKIYSDEILKLTNKNLINSAAHITGGGLVRKSVEIYTKKLTLNLDLKKLKF